MNKSILALVILFSMSSITPMNTLLKNSAHNAGSLIQASQKRDFFEGTGLFALGINMSTYIKNKSNQSESLIHLGHVTKNNNSIKTANKSMMLLGTSCIALPIGLSAAAMTPHDPSILYPIVSSFLLTTHTATSFIALSIAALGVKEIMQETDDLKELMAQEAFIRKTKKSEEKSQ